MAYYFLKTQKISAFCMPLAYELAPVALDLDKDYEYYYNMDDDDYCHDCFIKSNLFLNRVDLFFKENDGFYENAEELKAKVYSLFK
jgi:hypothetical protein